MSRQARCTRLALAGGVLILQPPSLGAQDGHGEDLCWNVLHVERPEVERLLAEGASPRLDCGSGATPLHATARLGIREFVMQLVARGADVDARDVHGRTPLMGAVETGHGDVIPLLLAAGADVKLRLPPKRA